MTVTGKLVVITSAPSCKAEVALEMAIQMKEMGQEVGLCLLQDAVLYLLRGNATPASESVGRALEAGIDVYYLEDDLAARGFGRDDTRAGCRPLGYGDLVDLMLDDGRVPLGAF